jgi:hypothetical protein
MTKMFSAVSTPAMRAAPAEYAVPSIARAAAAYTEP